MLHKEKAYDFGDDVLDISPTTSVAIGKLKSLFNSLTTNMTNKFIKLVQLEVRLIYQECVGG